ncbi:MAG: hypothetical protein AAGG51_20205 [Cyanobacteria bacterium P01_G01_bin.54]
MTHYRPYFSLQVQHAAVPPGQNTGFLLQPSLACAQQLRNYRLVLKPQTNGLRLLLPLEMDGQPPIPLPADLRWTFLLQLQDPTILARTQLDPSYQPQSLSVFRNEFLAAQDGRELTATRLQPTDPDPPADLATLSPAQRSRLFGIVEIEHHPAFTLAEPQPYDFTISFAVREQVWNYYLVVQKGTSFEDFSIKDKENLIQFTLPEIATEHDPIAATIYQRFPESQALVLHSQTAIACRARSRPNLQLIKQGTTKAWIPHLPNPPNCQAIQVINLLEEM